MDPDSLLDSPIDVLEAILHRMQERGKTLSDEADDRNAMARHRAAVAAGVKGRG